MLILVLTLMPGSSIPDYNLFDYDKLGHVGIFVIMAYLYISGHYVQHQNIRKSIITGFVLTVLYGALIEVLQDFIPQRSMDWTDMVANCSGSILGISVFYVSIKKNWQ